MFRLLRYYGRFQGVRGSVLGLPFWARLVLVLVALPGLILLSLSILALLVSLAALLLLTVPVYRLLRAVAGTAEPEMGQPMESSPTMAELFGAMSGAGGMPDSAEAASPGRRRVDVKIIESD
jgi:hypothetical protein